MKRNILYCFLVTVTLFYLQFHEEVIHNVAKETVAHLISRFCIARGRQAVIECIRPRGTCRIIQGQSLLRGNLLRDTYPKRSQEGHSFKSVCTNFTGPLFVKTSSNPQILQEG